MNNKFINIATEEDNKRKKIRKGNSSSTIATVYTISLGVFLILGSMSLLSPASINYVPKAFAVEESEIQTIDINFNEPTIAELDDVAVEIQPIQNIETGLTSLNMKVMDKDTKLPLTHVDWLISIKDQNNNNKLYESSTLHSHVGVNNFEYALDKGTYNILTQVASLGPKMMGMEVPGMAQTRMLESGDPMEGWKTDPNKFFGFKNVNFKLDVDNGVTTNADSELAAGSDTNLQDPNKNSITVSSETGQKVNVKLVTVPEKIVAGQPATVALNIMTENGTSITHPDGLITLAKDDGFTLLQSAEKGDPMMPVNGAFHGHTGQLAFDIVFPQAGVYTLDAELNSLPVSNVMFGKVDSQFNIEVADSTDDASPAAATTTTAETVTAESTFSSSSEVTTPINQISIVGQEAPFYSPVNKEVKQGDSIKFKNDDAIVHVIASTSDKIGTVSPNADGKFDTGILMMGQESNDITLDETRTINYFCTIHPFMQGSITVT
ncbi:MAG TPA: plastocyanin/azurin family copper-binding protein [Nitrososphaeraceae archaeon]|nr:plastocyanin/azurin family copper-binding protein [Nitrososphaeraceae archaeon]